jgi:hypothetical protein
VISFNEGASWSKRIPLASSHKNNRGFTCIVFDKDAGSMIVSWYDGRNSPDATSEQFFGAYISKKQLDKIVEELRCNSL